MNPYADAAIGGGGGSGDGGGSESECVVSVSYAAVAARLLQDNFLLTALELHTELVESGRELPQLREFFSNPGNFEQHVSRVDTGMHRTPSQATLDSLDLGRYSEDGGLAAGGGSSDIAVLEFELRKARETIHSLRANLTQFADCESTDTTKERLGGDNLKPHEKRALNFLVNEYLLLQSYKLTAITFSDENPDQDFEDWDDVGLNLPRPCGLISLYRGETFHSTEQAKDASTHARVSTAEVECQTEPLDDALCVGCQNSEGEEIDWHHEIIIQAEEILLLKRQILELETDKANYQKLYDAALASLNSLTTPVSDTPALDLSIPAEKLASANTVCAGKVCEQALMYAENHYGSNTSTSSVTPEQFEIIECDKNVNRKGGLNSSSLDVTPHASPMRRGGSDNTLDDTLSLNEAGEWTRLQHPDSTHSAADTWIDSSLPSELKSTILEWCCGRLNSTGCGNDLVDELAASEKPVTAQSLVPLAADTLLRILPHTLVSRRCEAAALVAATAHLLSSPPASHAARRAKLLQLLLTLLKKPDPNETNVISQAICLVVKWGGSGEVLSCVAELLSSRSAERRVLAANICLSIAPLVPIDLSASLLLSLVLMMCESTEHEIREIGLRTAILICLVAENKYSQFEGIVFAMIKDPVERIRKQCLCVLVPVLARSALRSGKFADLCHRTISQLSKYSSESDWQNTALYLNILRILAVPNLAYVINVQIVKDNMEKNCDETSKKCEGISIDDDGLCLDVQCYLCDFTLESTLLVDAMNRLVREMPAVRWKELEWFLDKIVSQLLEISMSCKLLNHSTTYHIFIRTFNVYCNVFGQEFTDAVIKPILSRTTIQLEKKLETLQPIDAGNLVCAGILLAAVLPSCCDWENEICDFLKRWVVCMGVCGLPVDVLAEPLKWLAANSSAVFIHCLRCISLVVASGEERSAAVRAGAATLLAELATSDDLPEDCFETDILPTVRKLLNHTDEGVRERSIVALGAVTRAAVSRSLRCRGECWRQLAEAAGAAERAGEAARVADALSVLLAPDIEGTDDQLPMQVLSLLCSMCHRAPLTADVCSSLIPGLQLAVHFARPPQHFIQSQLMPALRRLEKIDSPSLQQHKQAVDTLVQSVEPPGVATDSPTAPRQSGILAGPEAMGRRVTQIFQHSKTNMNIPNIFKKKS